LKGENVEREAREKLEEDGHPALKRIHADSERENHALEGGILKSSRASRAVTLRQTG
jgi:hypothetical protein